MEFVTTGQAVAPAGAPGATITPNGTAWADSAWSELLAATPGAIVLVGVTYSPNVTTGQSATFEIDIASGAAGAEAVACTVRGVVRSIISGGPCYIPLTLPIDLIGVGARVAARLRKSGTATTDWTVAITYLVKPIGGALTVATSAQKVAPPASAPSLSPNTTAWADSAWVEVAASLPACLVTGVSVYPGVSGAEYEVDLGVGAAGAEVVVTTVKGVSSPSSVYGGPWVHPLRPVLDAIPASSRVALRLRKAGMSSTAWSGAITYVEKAA